MINIPNNDSHIVDKDSLIIDLCQAMATQGSIDISLNGEGPCAQSLGLYDLLDRLCSKFNFDKTAITITTHNLAEKHAEYNICIKPQMLYLDSARTFANSNILKPKVFDHNFKHIGHFIGHGNLYRLHLASVLDKQHSRQLLQSYHYSKRSDYHRIFVGLEDMIFGNYTDDEIDCAYEFLKKTPKIIDDIDTYPILNPHTLNITKIYHTFFVEVVNLTYFSGNTFYIDEKIWRPMIMKTPFMIQGPVNYILNLRKIGFRTFDAWWDEGFNEDPGRCQTDGIISNINRICSMSTMQLQTMYKEMQQVLEHNYKLVKTISKNDFFI